MKVFVDMTKTGWAFRIERPGEPDIVSEDHFVSSEIAFFCAGAACCGLSKAPDDHRVQLFENGREVFR